MAKRGFRLSRRKAVELGKYSDSVNLYVLNEWMAVLDSLEDISLGGKTLAQTTKKECAFALATPVTLDDFAKAYLPAKKLTGYSYPAFKKAVADLPKLRLEVLRAGVNINDRALLFTKLSDPKTKAVAKKAISAYLASAGMIDVVRRWYNNARTDLQRALLRNEDLGYSLLVESIPKSLTNGGEAGYIIPGTLQSLQFVLDRMGGDIVYRQTRRGHAESAKKAVAHRVDPVKGAKRKTRKK